MSVVSFNYEVEVDFDFFGLVSSVVGLVFDFELCLVGVEISIG